MTYLLYGLNRTKKTSEKKVITILLILTRMVELPVWKAMLKFHMRNRIRLDEVFGSSVVVSFWCVADFLPESRKAEKQCSLCHCQIEVKTVQKKKRKATPLSFMQCTKWRKTTRFHSTT